MAQSSLVLAQEVSHWILGEAPSWPLLPFSSVLEIKGPRGEVTLFYGTKAHTEKHTHTHIHKRRELL
jgi:hypothetical protein